MTKIITIFFYDDMRKVLSTTYRNNMKDDKFRNN